MAQAIEISVPGSKEQLSQLIQFLSSYIGVSGYDQTFLSRVGGSILTDRKLVGIIRQKLLPKITLVAPNIHEAECLVNIRIENYQYIIIAGNILLQSGVKNILIKGEHFGSEFASDLFINTQQYFWLVSIKYRLSQNVHDTGFHLSSAITANIALGFELIDSIIIAKCYLNSALQRHQFPAEGAKQYYIRSLFLILSILTRQLLLRNTQRYIIPLREMDRKRHDWVISSSR